MSRHESAAARISPLHGAVPRTPFLGWRSEAGLSQPAMALLAPVAPSWLDAPLGISYEMTAWSPPSGWVMRPAAAPEAVINGTPGNDDLLGTADADTLDGLSGDDRLRGKGGDDMLFGNHGDDWLAGGKGNDTLAGGPGNDTYKVSRASGSDVIASYYDTAADKLNVLQYGANVSASDVLVTRLNLVGLVLTVAGTTSTVTIQNFFLYDDPGNASNELQEVHFADGTVWDITQLVTMTMATTPGDDTVLGTVADETIHGQDGNDRLDGRAGNDTLSGDAGNDILEGGTGNDTLNGNAGDDSLYAGNDDDVLDGGAGNDSFYSGLGDDTYLVGRGHGYDSVRADISASPSKLNVLQYDASVSPADITVYRDDSSLVLTITDTIDADLITVLSFFTDDDLYDWHCELQEVRFADGTVWDIEDLIRMTEAQAGAQSSANSAGDAEIGSWCRSSSFATTPVTANTSHMPYARYADQTEALVSAMAAFAPPAAGQTALLADYHVAISPIAIAVS